MRSATFVGMSREMVARRIDLWVVGIVMSSSFLVDSYRLRKLNESATKEAVLLSGSRKKAALNRERANLNRQPYFLNREMAAIHRQLPAKNRPRNIFDRQLLAKDARLFFFD